MTSSADLRADVLHAMRRLASRGEVDVAPSRIADLISPRPSQGAMTRALGDMWECGLIDDGRLGLGRYRLAPEPWSAEPEQVSMDVGA